MTARNISPKKNLTHIFGVATMRSEYLMAVNTVMVFQDETPYNLEGRYEHLQETIIWKISLSQGIHMACSFTQISQN
jgi:hypothetical protein